MHVEIAMFDLRMRDKCLYILKINGRISLKTKKVPAYQGRREQGGSIMKRKTIRHYVPPYRIP